MFERMGVTVTDERPYEVTPRDAAGRAGSTTSGWSRAGGRSTLDDDVRDRFQDGFARVWHGDAEHDGFNGLILGAGPATGAR